MAEGVEFVQTSLQGGATPLVSIVVVSYNTVDLTLDCLRSVFETAEGVDYELIVVDNDSSDGSADAIEAAFPASAYPRLRFIRLDENIGFGRANNFAATEAKGAYLLLLNPDTIVHERAIQNLLEFAERRPEAGIWGGRTLFKDGALNPTSCWGEMTLWTLTCFAFGLSMMFPRSELFNAEAYGGWPRDSEREVSVVTGCFLLIKTEFWRKLGGFDERFFMYAEEADLCLRAWASGARPSITPKAEIVHYGGASEKARGPKIGRVFAGKISLADKHWKPWRASVARFLFRLAVLVRMVGYGAAAKLLGRDKHREAYDAWAYAWNARRQWLSGYL